MNKKNVNKKGAGKVSSNTITDSHSCSVRSFLLKSAFSALKMISAFKCVKVREYINLYTIKFTAEGIYYN